MLFVKFQEAVHDRDQMVTFITLMRLVNTFQSLQAPSTHRMYIRLCEHDQVWISKNIHKCRYLIAEA